MFRSETGRAPKSFEELAALVRELPDDEVRAAFRDLGEPPEGGMVEVAAHIDHPLAQRVGGVDELG